MEQWFTTFSQNRFKFEWNDTIQGLQHQNPLENDVHGTDRRTNGIS